jgi:zinc transport system substrate-binding protein
MYIMKFKKIVILALSIAMLIAMTSCSDLNRTDESKPTVVCTGFAQYDWVLNILGDEAENWNVIRINDKGADMHSYQPSAEDMIVISKADILIYTGGMSEERIVDAMESQDFQGKSYALLDNCEPICIEDDHGHEGHDHESGDEHEHHGHSHDEYDEHAWLSLKNAKAFCQDISKLLDEIYPSPNYSKNCENYIDKIDELNSQFNFSVTKSIVFADRFPFRYLAEDFDLAWYAAFPGCSAETEASFDTLKELSNVIKEDKPAGVFVTETGDDSLAKTVIANSGEQNIEIIKVNSMQSIPKGETRGYLEIMEENLSALEKVLK